MQLLRLLPLAALLLPAACGDPAPPPPLSTAPPPLEMVLLANSDEVDVALRDPQPVVSARLIDPEGQEYPVGKITYARETEGQSAGIQPQLRMNAAGGSTGTTGAGVGLSLPLLGSPGPAADRVVVSYFSVRIIDMAAYRASWQRWKFHVTLGATKSNRREIEFLPPRPPG
jgi:hypothetical protein